MKQNVIEIEINCTVDKVFEFTTNPANTSKWIPSVAKEWVEDDAIQVGTLYHQLIIDDGQQIESSYRVTEWKLNSAFKLQKVGSMYQCAYTYISIEGDNTTKLIYSEQMTNEADLEEPLSVQPFLVLRSLLEAEYAIKNE